MYFLFFSSSLFYISYFKFPYFSFINECIYHKHQNNTHLNVASREVLAPNSSLSMTSLNAFWDAYNSALKWHLFWCTQGKTPEVPGWGGCCDIVVFLSVWWHWDLPRIRQTACAHPRHVCFWLPLGCLTPSCFQTQKETGTEHITWPWAFYDDAIKHMDLIQADLT